MDENRRPSTSGLPLSIGGLDRDPAGGARARTRRRAVRVAPGDGPGRDAGLVEPQCETTQFVVPQRCCPPDSTSLSKSSISRKLAESLRRQVGKTCAFVINQAPPVYVLSYVPAYQEALSSLFEAMKLAAILRHEVAHLEGADERHAPLIEAGSFASCSFDMRLNPS